MQLGISDQYFGFDSLGHRRDCRLSGTNLWETTVHRTDYGALPRDDDELRRDGCQVVVRMVCRACGVVRIETGESYSRECTNVQAIGFGSKPTRAAGLWLHPGPPFFVRDDHGPEAYYLTGSRDDPTTREDVIGVIGWRVALARGRVWWAAYGLRASVLRTGSVIAGSAERPYVLNPFHPLASAAEPRRRAADPRRRDACNRLSGHR